jgi:high-affinity nickel-transport protein
MAHALSISLIGLLLGMRHATDPDHVIAVSTIVSRERSLWRAMRIGALWGIGHTVTIVVVGGAIILLKIVVPAAVGLTMELGVAVMLVVLGVATLRDRGNARALAPSATRPVAIGIVHGMAGSAAVALLVVATIGSAAWAVAYLLVFGLGTVVGMSLVTIAIAAPTMLAIGRVGAMQRYLRLGSGLASVAFGLFLAHRIGFHDGLFTGHPSWTPE